MSAASQRRRFQAYPFSFGHYREGIFHTIMSYGFEPEIAVLSNPNLDSCSGQACGWQQVTPIPRTMRGFTQVRFMVAGYESESLASELVSVFPMITRPATRSDGTEGFQKGPAIDNQSPQPSMSR
ncbi:MAG: hypothetical protein CM15mP103_06180 [Gammaproteobacteria bacterium]|nr:MAG: hypothetical protein CM15mP103_06180 [Gammaproteobacteria bacterium]